MSNSVRIRPLVGALALAGLASLSLPAHAASTQDELEALKQTVRELQKRLEELDQSVDQKVKIVERKQELVNEDVSKKLKDAPTVTASNKGFSIRSSDKDFEFKLRGLAQIDYRVYDGDAHAQTTGNVPVATDGFLARRLRPTFEGTLFGKYGFRFTPEFAESGDGGAAAIGDRRNNRVRVVDAYFDVNANDAYKFRIGKHKPFVGLERLQSGSDIKFIERSYVSNNILPNRDIGVSVHGDVLDKKLNYAVGYFNGVADGGDNFTSVDDNTDKDFAWRLFSTPFAGSGGILEGLGFGVAGTWANDSNTNALPRYRTPGQNQFFAYRSTTTANGSRTRISPQAYYYNGPLGVLAEYAQVKQDVSSSTAGVGSAELKNDAWQIAATWLLTGEDASFKGVKPFQPFKFGEPSGWGAWEVGLRYQENNLDRDAARFADPTATNRPGFALGARSWGVGLSWYHNENSKFLVNYESTSLDDVTAGTGASAVLRGDKERFLSFRYQVAY
ncbi:MAG: porin [Burkholderiales bacterium]